MGKAKKKREHMKSMPFETVPAHRLTPAQEIMRRDILGRTTPKSNPERLAAVLDAEVGAIEPDPDVVRMAHVIIEEHGQGLSTGLKEWAIIQRMVEVAIRVDPGDL